MSSMSSITMLILALSLAVNTYLVWSLHTTQQAFLRGYDRQHAHQEARPLPGAALPSGTLLPAFPMSEAVLPAALLPNEMGSATLGGYVTYDVRCLPERGNALGGQVEELTVSNATSIVTTPSPPQDATDRLVWTVSTTRP